VVTRNKDSALTMLMLSSNGGETWAPLLNATTRDSSYQWNTGLCKDGTRYKLRLMIAGSDTLFGFLDSPMLTIDNPGNGLPEIVINQPVKNDTLRGYYDLRWTAGDPEGDSLRIALKLSGDNGTTWETLADNLQNTGVYHWNTVSAPNGSSLLLKLVCSDGTGESSATISPVMIRNARKYLSASSFSHISGSGDGAVRAALVDGASVKRAEYRISFQNSAGGVQYSVREIASARIVINNIPVPQAGNEGPLFDGIRLIIDNYERPTAADDSCRWLSGASTVRSETAPTFVVLGADTLKGIASPYDYEIRLFDHVVDTSSDYAGAIRVPISFTVTRRQDSRRVTVVLNDFDGNGTISPFDELYFLEPSSGGPLQLTWYVFFTKGNPDIAPRPGDVYLIRIMKPYREQDTISLLPVVSFRGSEIASSTPLDFKLYQNYPNPFNPATTVRYELPAAARLTMELYSVLGRRVKSLFDGRQEAGTYLLRVDAAELPSGVYFLRMNARIPGVSPYQSIRKMILLK
jgi:hypothetical protein